MEKQAQEIREYMRCPRAYQLLYEAGVKPTRVSIRTWLDAILRETVFNIMTLLMSNEPRKEDTFYRHWQERISQVPRNISCPEGTNPGSILRETTAYAMNFYKLAYGSIHQHWDIVAVSVPFYETFGGVVVNHSIDVVGRAGGSDDVMIIDLHKNPPSDFFLRSSIWEWLQIHGYRKLFRKLEQNAFLISAKNDDASVSTVPLPRPTQRELHKMESEIGAICTHLRNDVESGNWCPNYGWYCERNCGFLDICEGMGKDEPTRNSPG